MSSRGLGTAYAMFTRSSIHDPKVDGFQTTESSVRKLKGDNGVGYFPDQETMELYLKASAQKEEILLLREQIAIASMKELQLLNEKCALERKISDLRLAIDEKQNEAITSSSKELAQRKGNIEDNFTLTNDLKDAEDDKYIFTSSLIGLLAEYSIWPRVINASAISNSVKHLHDQLQLKIMNSNGQHGFSPYNQHTDEQHLGPIDNMSRYGVVTGSFPNTSSFDSGPVRAKEKTQTLLHTVHNQNDSFDRSFVKVRAEEKISEALFHPPSAQGQTVTIVPDGLVHKPEVQHNFSSYNPYIDEWNSGLADNISRNVTGPIPYGSFDRGFRDIRAKENSNEILFHHSTRPDASSDSEEEHPGIESFQIIGDAKPGSKLLACGFPVRGTSLCIFQWIRHLQDGTLQYIEGATNPDYVVTADDVDKLISVECVPMDENGRQGELVKLFANDQNKITCDPKMQLMIDTYMSKGQAMFSVLLLIDSPDNWEAATLILRRSGFQVKVNNTETLAISENFSKHLSIKIPYGLSTQFVLTCSGGSSYPFNAYNDVGMRDTIVLTMRMFQSRDDNRWYALRKPCVSPHSLTTAAIGKKEQDSLKHALDEKRKGRA